MLLAIHLANHMKNKHLSRYSVYFQVQVGDSLRYKPHDTRQVDAHNKCSPTLGTLYRTEPGLVRKSAFTGIKLYKCSYRYNTLLPSIHLEAGNKTEILILVCREISINS